MAHPLNNETRRMIEDKVLGEYERILSERGEALPQAVARDEHAAPLPVAAVPVMTQDRTLEEIEEIHLRDSFWSVT